MCIRSLLYPFLIFGKSEEVSALIAFGNLLYSSVVKQGTRLCSTYTDNRCDKFDQELGKLEK